MRSHVVAWLEQFLPSTAAQLLAPTWFTMTGLAGLLTLWVLLRHARRDGVDSAAVATVALVAYVAAVSAGVLVPLAIELGQGFVRHGTVRIRYAGMTSFWGYLGGALAVWVMCRRGTPPLGWLVDRATAMLGVSLAMIRTGCFLAGCDYGQVTSSSFALRFPRGSPAWRDHVREGLVPAHRDLSLPVHPTQLYEAAFGLLVAIAAWAYTRRRERVGRGRVFLAAAVAYAVARLGIESLRGDDARGYLAGMSSGQVFALALLGAVALGAAVRGRIVTR